LDLSARPFNPANSNAPAPSVADFSQEDLAFKEHISDVKAGSHSLDMQIVAMKAQH